LIDTSVVGFGLLLLMSGRVKMYVFKASGEGEDEACRERGKLDLRDIE
jgi:hypothetical protein